MASTLAILEIQDPGNLQNTIITIKGADGTYTAGANGIAGKISLRNKDGHETINLNGQSGEISQSGDLILKDENGNERVRISGKSAEITIKTVAGVPVMKINGAGNLEAGGGGQDGDLTLKDKDGKAIIFLGADEQVLVIQKADGNKMVELGKGGNLHLGGAGEDGDVFVKNGAGQDTIWLRGQTGDIHLGANGQAGNLFVQDQNANITIHLDGASGNAVLGGTTEIKQNLIVSELTTTKDLTVTGTAKIEQGLDASELTAKNITVTNSSGTPTIKLLGNEGDIQLLNADCAEEFDIIEAEKVDAGTVMVLDQAGRLRQSTEVYDKKVAGVISGAGNYKPGIVLDKQHGQDNRMPVALMGKVFCKVDADYSSIEVGDLLTTSPTPGYAMKADDPIKAFGAVIGKALRSLPDGKGLIPIIVALQ